MRIRLQNKSITKMHLSVLQKLYLKTDIFLLTCMASEKKKYIRLIHSIMLESSFVPARPEADEHLSFDRPNTAV